MKKKVYKTKKTFTKKWMNIIMLVALIDLQLPFILAFLGRTEIAETLGITIVTEIIGIFLIYCAKSFFETKEVSRRKTESLVQYQKKISLTKELTIPPVDTTVVYSNFIPTSTSFI